MKWKAPANLEQEIRQMKNMRIDNIKMSYVPPFSVRIGVCMTCAPSRVVFLNQLYCLESGKSCFQLGHNVREVRRNYARS